MAKKKQRPALQLTDTTFRDGNQSLLGGHLMPDEILPIAARMEGVPRSRVDAFEAALRQALEAHYGPGPFETPGEDVVLHAVR